MLRLMTWLEAALCAHLKTRELAYPHIIKKDDESARLENHPRLVPNPKPGESSGQ